MKFTILYSLRSAMFCCAASSLLLAAVDVHAGISQSPLSLTIGVAPNMILTLDDSGSMREAFTPESIDNQRDTRRVKSATYNTIYYNPLVTYKIPKKFAADGTESGNYSTSFNNAYYNGFQPTLGALDLSNNYRVSWWYKPSVAHSTSFTANDPNYNYRQFADNPSADFGGGIISTNATTNSSIRTNQEQGNNLRNCPTSIPISNNSTDTTEANADGTTTTITIANTINYSNAVCINTGTRRNPRYTLTADENITTTTTTTVKVASAIQKGVAAYYYNYNSTLPNCSGAISDDNCYKLVTVSNTSGINGTDERQNFAIWYSFYRNRALATLSAARLAFTDLSPAVRFTWQSLNRCTSLNGTASNCGGDNKLREYAPAQRGRFFSWLDTLDFFSGTPLRPALDRAGKFLQTETAWHKFPNGTGNSSSNTYACRPSYHVLMTDGIWNGDDGSPTDTRRHDSTSFDLPDGKRYTTALTPYSDNTNNTLADLAMHYWATDLNTTLANKLSPYIPFKSDNSTADYWNPRNDPATWQHLVNFTMGLGLTRSLNLASLPWEGSTFAGEGYENFATGTKPWPTVSADNNNNVYDLWHAAINSRGEFFSVDSPEAMVQAFSDILSRIADRKSTAAKPAINSGQVVIDANDPENPNLVTSSYQTSYASDENWSGNLIRKDKTWSEKPQGSGKFELELNEKWNAKDKIPAADARNITIKSSGSTGLQAFTWENAGNASTSGTLANLLSKDPEVGTVDIKGQDRLNYLRGVRTGEGSTFRTRSSVLGDLFSSSPAVVSGTRYLTGVANRVEGNEAYTSFKESVANRKSRVYVGGNDGMLHGFNAETGVEEFAFIPSAVFPKLNKLTGKNYSHEFYVDGSPVVADIYDGSKWRTILVGTLRAGGKSIFALDITTPGSEKLLWEFDDSKITSTVKMGYSFSQPTIARLHNGRWAVVFGNGYEASNHTNGKAALFIVDAIDGTLDKSLEVSGIDGIANGLSTPRLADNNGDSVADYAYAGDLQGNLWRFDLLPSTRDTDNPLARSATETRGSISQYEVAYGGKPMFTAVASNTAETPQPITAAPALVRHPSGVGHLVIFATGKYFEDTDKDGNKNIAQTVYGIWDEKSRGEKLGTTSALGITRAKLVEQTISSEVTATDSKSRSTAARIISQNAIPWDEKKGWLLDLKQGATLDGEMVIEPMINIGQSVYFQSLVPNDDPCADGASNWTYGLNAFTGGKTPYNVFDMQQVKPDGTTAIVSAIKQDGEGGLTVTDTPDGLEICTGQGCEGIKPPPNINARNSWRRIEEIE